MRKKLEEIIRSQEQGTTFGVRGVDERLEIGQILGTSYQWDHEYDMSSIELGEPVELGGVCATGIDSHNWLNYFVDLDNQEEVDELIDAIIDAYRYNLNYPHDYRYLIVGQSVNHDLADDEREIILAAAVVLYEFPAEQPKKQHQPKKYSGEYPKYIKTRQGYIGVFSHIEYGMHPIYRLDNGREIRAVQELEYGSDNREDLE